MLKVADRLVVSPFGLLGSNENALTFALGYLYHSCPDFLVKTLHRIGIKGIRKTTLKNIEVSLQTYDRATGITDVELKLENIFMVIIEAKIGLATPNDVQCNKYIFRLDSGEYKDKLLVILQNPDSSTVKNNNLKVLLWSEVLEDAISLFTEHGENTQEGYLLRSFATFCMEEYDMKAYTHEVWIVPGSPKPLWEGGLSHYDIHTKTAKIYYRNDRSTCRPLYIAFRNKGFDTIQRVKRIICEGKPIEWEPQLKNVYGWPKENYTIWELSDPIKLGKTIKTGPNMLQRHVYCNFEDLLKYDSVAEIEKKKK